VAEGDGLLNRCTTLKSYRGFESLRLRSFRHWLASSCEMICSESERSERFFRCFSRGSEIGFFVLDRLREHHTADA
jgi:hypothetical protein